MPKLKTKRGAAKRFRRTAKGYKHKRTNKNHLFIGKSTKRKRQLRGFADVSDADRSLVDRMLPGRKRSTGRAAQVQAGEEAAPCQE